MNNNKYITKAFIAITAGALVTLLVNDSGVVSSATTILYIAIPFTLMIIKELIFNNK